MVGDARVVVHAAAIVGEVAHVLERIRDLAGVAEAAGVPHVAERAEDLRIRVVLADQPARRFVGADLKREGRVGRKPGLDRLAVGVGDLDGGDRRAPGQAEEAARGGHEDDTRRSGVEGVRGACHRAALVRNAVREQRPVDDGDLSGDAADGAAGAGRLEGRRRRNDRHIRGTDRERQWRLEDRDETGVGARRAAARDRHGRRRGAEVRGAGVGAARPVEERERFAAVDAVDGLAEDVRIGLVECARLPFVDEAVGVLGVGVRPIVARHVVRREAVAERDESAVPRRIRTLVAAVEDRVQHVAGAVIGVAAEGVVVEVVHLFGRCDHVVGFRDGRREGLSLDPERRARILRRNDRQKPAVVGAPGHGVVDAGQPVDDLARVRVDVDELAHVDVVAHLDLPDEVVAPGWPRTRPAR